MQDLQKELITLFKWFTEILLKANPENSHLLTNTTQEIQIAIVGMAIFSNKCKKTSGKQNWQQAKI